MTVVPLTEHRQQARLMGSAFEFVTVTAANDPEDHLDTAVAEVRRMEALLTEFSDTSQTARLNRAAGIHAVDVDPEVYAILQRCREISRLTQGAFDITAGVLKKLYDFRNKPAVLPGRAAIDDALQRVGWDKIVLTPPGQAYLPVPGMHIGFGAIGKGYAADKVKSVLLQKGIRSGVINASGDLTAWGTRPDGTPWKVGIADPDAPDRVMAWIPVHQASVATSGNYEQYVEIDGTRYSHNIDPKTGLPVHGIKSATVVSPSAELSDALATAVTVMGPAVGLHFIDQLPNTHCLIIDDQNRLDTSRRLSITLNPAP
ncbi:FAD:protein FMN transferase [Dawidia soli]|uniref:FAD:protein FMN transferase n=1 Tax=Dawidia soli TaxID=2782352 RepID=A0AAP2DH28_9BACT|nr:FAD:protein FMN transferase [Dawidia soli]MBT1690705.1 FAD:protein FMN transferase [Dawidia soli]